MQTPIISHILTFLFQINILYLYTLCCDLMWQMQNLWKSNPYFKPYKQNEKNLQIFQVHQKPIFRPNSPNNLDTQDLN